MRIPNTTTPCSSETIRTAFRAMRRSVPHRLCQTSKGNLTGSIAEYSFHFVGESEYLFVFEAPIDMLAYISMNKRDWEKHSYVALCSTADRAACQMLKDYPNLKTVFFASIMTAQELKMLSPRRVDSRHRRIQHLAQKPPEQGLDEDLKERADGIAFRHRNIRNSNISRTPATTCRLAM